MKTITVQVKEDHLETLARSRPMTAMSELIWNALDAEASEVRVEFDENDLGGIECIRIIDNGHGLYYEDAFIVFQNLGGSWKRQGRRTSAQKRQLHGKFGKGRFRAFSLGNNASWTTVYDEAGQLNAYSISGKAEKLGEFTLTDPRAAAEGQRTGMRVQITQAPENAGLLRGGKAVQEVTDLFALYLRQYPGIKLIYDGVPIDPANAEERYTEYDLGEMVLQNGERIRPVLSVVEWNVPGKRGVYYCDDHGFMLCDAIPRLHFRGFSYTAYLKSAHFVDFDREGLLQAGEMVDDLRMLLEHTRQQLREHFALREAERAKDTIVLWKELGIYPYEGEPKKDQEINERRIFDIYSTHLNQILGDFQKTSLVNKRLVLRLMQALVRVQPTHIARILDEMVALPEDKEDAILELTGSRSNAN